MSAEACECEEGLPEWIMSYADMITILMAFFVVMYSMAGDKDPKKEEAVMNSLRMWLGGISAPWPNLRAGEGTRPDGKGNGPHAGRSSIPSSVRRPSTAGDVLYFSGQELPLTTGEQARLRQIADSLAGKRHLIEIRGRPSPRPLAPTSPYRDPLDATYDKCRRVRDYLISHGIEPQRIQLVLNTAQAPGGSSDDPQLLAHDVRVDVLLIGQFLAQPQRTRAARVEKSAEPVPDR